MKCRHCNNILKNILIDLGKCPPSNSYLSTKKSCTNEKNFPLKVYVCNFCWLVQTEDIINKTELFTKDYAYFSSYSKTWLKHVSDYTNHIISRLELTEKSLVVEIASNDGCLLDNFKKRNIPCFGIEPTESSVKVAISKDLKVYQEFFSSKFAMYLSKRGELADLIIANNVLAHVPDINDFLRGFIFILKNTGTVTFEFPHLIKMIELMQFDTIYHEHFSYLSLSTCHLIFNVNGLEIYDVDEISTHGGSLRVYAQKKGGNKKINRRVQRLINYEKSLGVFETSFYKNFSTNSKIIRNNLIDFLQKAKIENQKVIGYGAAAKGNTFLNFANIDQTMINYVVDKNPMKHGKFLPGSHIPIYEEEKILADKPDYIIILPWNLKKEIINQLNYIREWKGKFVTFQPKMEIL